MKLDSLYHSIRTDILAIAKAKGIDIRTADGGKTGLKTMHLLLTFLSRDRAYDDAHPAYASGYWTRVLPFDGRDYCFYYEGGCNDTHLATLLRKILKSLPPSERSDQSQHHLPPMKTNPKTIAAYRHDPVLYASQQPDTQPGNYYVTCRCPDTGNTWLMLGPFPNDHAAALAAVPAVRDAVAQHDSSGRGHFYAYGTVRMADDFTRPGNANKHLPHLLPAAWSLESTEQALSRTKRQPTTV